MDKGWEWFGKLWQPQPLDASMEETKQPRQDVFCQVSGDRLEGSPWEVFLNKEAH